MLPASAEGTVAAVFVAAVMAVVGVAATVVTVAGDEAVGDTVAGDSALGLRPGITATIPTITATHTRTATRIRLLTVMVITHTRTTDMDTDIPGLPRLLEGSTAVASASAWMAVGITSAEDGKRWATY